MLTFPPDISFVFQLVSFLILWVGLKRLLFDPMLQVLAAREARTVGTSREAAAMKTAAEERAAEYERRLGEIRHQLAAEVDAGRNTTQSEERQVIAAARDQVTAQLLELRQRLAQEAESARAVLAAEARELSTRMLNQVVGKTSA